MSYFGSIYDEELPHRAKAVYMYLKDRANTNDESWYAINSIATDLKLSRSTVQRALRDLVRDGQIEKQYRYRDNGSNTSNLYRLK